VGGLEDAVGTREGDGERLVDEDRDAGAQECDRLLLVGVVRGGEEDGVEVREVRHGIGEPHPLTEVPARPLLRPRVRVEHGDDVALSVGAGGTLGDDTAVAVADHSEPKMLLCWHGPSPLSTSAVLQSDATICGNSHAVCSTALRSVNR